MIVSATTAAALEHIATRQADLRAAFTPGARATHDDVLLQTGSDFTLDLLSAAAPPDSYFVGLDQRGRQCYTREGSFRVQDGTLRDSTGAQVLGYAKDGTLEPIRFDPVDVALGRTANTQVDTSGVVSYTREVIEPRTGRKQTATVVAGQLALARFSAATRLQPLDTTHLLSPNGVMPYFGKPGDGNFAGLQTHARERSAIDFNTGIEKLSDAYMALDALRAAHSAEGKAEKTAMDLVK